VCPRNIARRVEGETRVHVLLYTRSFSSFPSSLPLEHTLPLHTCRLFLHIATRLPTRTPHPSSRFNTPALPFTFTMFNWLRRKKAASSGPSAHDEDAGPPPIRKPQHAYRDARMSIPVAEREFYETIQARKLASNTSSNAASITNSKGKIRSPLRYGSGERYISIPLEPVYGSRDACNADRETFRRLPIIHFHSCLVRSWFSQWLARVFDWAVGRCCPTGEARQLCTDVGRRELEGRGREGVGNEDRGCCQICINPVRLARLRQH
jgi:hypothetical protein